MDLQVKHRREKHQARREDSGLGRSTRRALEGVHSLACGMLLLSTTILQADRQVMVKWSSQGVPRRASQ